METCGQRAQSFWGPRLSRARVNHICLHRSSGEALVQACAAGGMDLFVLVIAGHETFLSGLVWSILLELKCTLPSQLAAAPLSILRVPASWAGVGRGEMRGLEWPSGINICPAGPKDVLQQDCGLWHWKTI